MSLAPYDLRGEKRKRPRRPPRKWTPRDRKVAGFVVYLAVVWLVYQLPQAALTRWFIGWMG